MRIAFLARDYPYPPMCAPEVRTYELVRELAKHHELELFCFRTDTSRAAADLSKMSEWCRVHLFEPPARTRLQQLREFAEPFYVKAFSGELAAKLAERHRAQPFDVIHCEELKMARYALWAKRRLAGARVSLTHHNVESELFPVLMAREGNPLVRILHKLQLGTIRDLEQRLFRELDFVFCLSERDRDVLGALYGKPANLFAPGTGVNLDDLSPAPVDDARALLFVGTMAYNPNHDGLMWFLSRVFPDLPGFRLAIVGRGPPREELLREVARFGDRVRIVESPREMRPHLAAAGLVIVPIFDGSGVRFKVLEAFAAAKAVVSTKLGVMGIDAADSREVLLADEPAAFRAALERVAQDESLRRALGTNARALVEKRYSWSVVASGIVEHYQRGAPPKSES